MKKNRIEKWSAGVLAAGMLTSPFVAAPAAFAATEPIKVDAKAALIIDNETNKILLNQNGDESLGIASMTKMLSAYVILDALKEGKITWDQTVPISDYALKISQNYELSNVPLRTDFTYTVKDLYEAMLIYSGNAAAIALAELIAGSEPEFVDMMTAQLDEWGVKDYAIYNSSGLPNNYAQEQGQLYPGAPVEQENHMTARGVATVADHLLDDYPEVLDTTKITEKVFMEGSGDEIPMTTYNFMLPGMIFGREGVDGLKTGTNDESGASFTGTAVEGDMRIITVLIGTEDHDARFSETDRMMDYAFDHFEKVQVVKKGDAVEGEGTIPVAKGKEEEVDLLYNTDVTLVLPKDGEKDFTTNLSLNSDLLNKDGLVEAPIEKGTEVGNVSLQLDKDELGYLDGKVGEDAKVAVAETVEKANVFVIGWRWVAGAFSNGWTTVTDFISGFFG